ncbi:hypothetical protein [Andreprevotia chitinilytica]|uniref:hypothetical protein n=1 Tax=Andreprevotia chitinilytica TaxID=396808 RepID=UPI00054EACAC|nr:hypothetical protein [Andreprevotia chitinilytica]
MTAAMETNSTDAKEAVLQFIAAFHDAIATQSPKKIEALLGSLILTERNKYWRNYEFPPIHLAGGAMITPGRIAMNGNRLEIFGNFKISGICIIREDIMQQYGQLPLTGWPKLGVPVSETNYTATFANSAIDFGFAEKNPDCLRTVGTSILNPPPYPFGKPD